MLCLLPPRSAFHATRIYLDNAATSWPKPDAVYDAVDKYLRENGAPAGRSAYTQAADVERTIASARAAVARLIGATDAKQIIFTSNGTEALNLAIHGLLRPGDHAICTWADHNSVLRPLRHLEEHGNVQVTRVRCDAAGLVESRRHPPRAAAQNTARGDLARFERHRRRPAHC